MLPRSLHFELPGNAMNDVRYSGGFADVLRCESGGREIAVKILRPQGLSLQEVRRVSQDRRASLPGCISELTVRFPELLQGSHHLEITPASECAAADWGNHDWKSIRYGV